MDQWVGSLSFFYRLYTFLYIVDLSAILASLETS
jgi:hypothetical protein